MKTILLTSAGMRMSNEILKLLPKPPHLIKIAHIITATNVFKVAPWMIKDKEKMLKLGFQVEDIDIEGKTEIQLEKLLSYKDVIYVQGGDPYYLLKQVKSSGFEKVVKKTHLQRDSIYRSKCRILHRLSNSRNGVMEKTQKTTLRITRK